jgi:hypothetical protein
LSEPIRTVDPACCASSDDQLEVSYPPARVAGKSVWAPCPDTKKYNFAMSSELADGFAVTAVIVRIKVSVEANEESFALSSQRAGRAQRAEREFGIQDLP